MLRQRLLDLMSFVRCTDGSLGLMLSAIRETLPRTPPGALQQVLNAIVNLLSEICLQLQSLNRSLQLLNRLLQSLNRSLMDRLRFSGETIMPVARQMLGRAFMRIQEAVHELDCKARRLMRRLRSSTLEKIEMAMQQLRMWLHTLSQGQRILVRIMRSIRPRRVEATDSIRATQQATQPPLTCRLFFHALVELHSLMRLHAVFSLAANRRDQRLLCTLAYATAQRLRHHTLTRLRLHAPFCLRCRQLLLQWTLSPFRLPCPALFALRCRVQRLYQSKRWLLRA